jgi:hypothetical protein
MIVHAERRLALLERDRPSHALKSATRLADLDLRLRETAAWCERNLDAGSIQACLRPWSIAPSLLARDRWESANDVANRRRQELRDAAADTRQRAPGKLLVYFPDADLTDGAAEVASQGFFDVYNAPPWGTWVGYFNEPGRDVSYSAYLVAWVPERLIPLASAGIEVNPEECIQWLADTDVGIRQVVELLESRREAR